MRALGMMLLLGLVACTAPAIGHKTGDAAAVPAASAPFSGVWEACEGASSPGECSRYVLVQRGEKICGTWSYFASGKGYDGRVIAHVSSATRARRTHVCGRPGSETRMECEDGWEAIDKPLVLCDGKLGDLVGADDTCSADYQAVLASRSGHDALFSQPWVQECLSRDP